MNHFTILTDDLARTVERLKAKRVAHELRRVPEYGTWQLFFHDPNGARVEIDFEAREAAPA